MKMTISSMLIIALLVIQGCTTVQTVKMSAVASPEQQIGDNNRITSQKKHFVSVAPVQLRKQGVGNPPPMISFKLSVRNCGEKPIDISSDNVSVIFKGKTDGVSRRLTVRSFDNLINESARKDMEEAVARSRADDYSSRNSDFAQPDILLDSPDGFSNKRKKAVEESVMKPQTIMPGESADGLVVFDTKKLDYRVEGDFQVIVSVDGEEHEFTFKRSRQDEK